MNSVERGAAWVAVVVAVFGAGAAWDSLSNRIDRVNEKIGEIQKTLGSTPCTAILTRQLAAIDRGRADIRKALDGLSDQYGCEPARSGSFASMASEPSGDTATNTSTATAMNVSAETVSAAKLTDTLNAVDVQLNASRKN